MSGVFDFDTDEGSARQETEREDQDPGMFSLCVVCEQFVAKRKFYKTSICSRECYESHLVLEAREELRSQQKTSQKISQTVPTEPTDRLSSSFEKRFKSFVSKVLKEEPSESNLTSGNRISSRRPVTAPGNKVNDAAKSDYDERVTKPANNSKTTKTGGKSKMKRIPSIPVPKPQRKNSRPSTPPKYLHQQRDISCSFNTWYRQENPSILERMIAARED